MTENEELEQYREIGKPEELKQLKENGAFTGMELAQIAIMQMELKKYMAIGTVEECRAAMEKQRAKKPAAYDVDKVVEQLNKATTDEDGIVAYIDGKPVITKEKAIGIVKAVE